MNLMLSINRKFLNIDPNQLIEMVIKYDKGKYISGFELCYNYKNKTEKQYMDKLIDICLEKKYIIQFHSNSKFDIDYQKGYLDYCNKISLKLGYKIKIVYHPCSSDNTHDAIEMSNEYIARILKYVYDNKYNLLITMENLNRIREFARLEYNDLIEIFQNNNDLMLTYDIGHEIFNKGQITKLDEKMIHKIKNVHIHTYKGKKDHLPLYNDDKNKNQWISGIVHLKEVNYNDSVVLEYDLYKFPGEKCIDKVVNYISSASFIIDYF